MNLIISINAETDREYTDAGHIFLGSASTELPCEVHIFWKKNQQLPNVQGNLSSEQVGEVLRWLRASIDLSVIDSPVFLRRYLDTIEDAYRQQVADLQMARDENRSIWESNERIMKENADEIARLNRELNEAQKGIHPGGG